MMVNAAYVHDVGAGAVNGPTKPALLWAFLIFKGGFQNKTGACSARQGHAPTCERDYLSCDARMGVQRKRISIAIESRICAPCVRAGAGRGQVVSKDRAQNPSATVAFVETSESLL